MVIAVVRQGDTQTGLAKGAREERLDLVLADLHDPERAEREDVPDRRQGVGLRISEDHRAVTIEREDRGLRGREGRCDEPAALIEPKDDVGRPGHVVDRADG